MPADGYWAPKVLFDLAWYAVAFCVTAYFRTRVFKPDEVGAKFPSNAVRWYYHLAVIAGAMLGGTVISTFDGFMIPGRNPEGAILVSKSIAGAIFWGVITAESIKKNLGITGPTGALFLPGIVTWVFTGRIGAYVLGIRDFTYGLPTNLPWGVDFWDGIARHPTMAYEMLLLGIFFLIFCLGLAGKRRAWWVINGFYAFVLTYFAYRFAVGFIQPYSTFWFGLSTYQFIALPMMAYGWLMMRKYSKIS